MLLCFSRPAGSALALALLVAMTAVPAQAQVVIRERELPPAGFPMRMLSRMMRPMVLRKAMTGFKLPAKTQDALWPTDEVSVEVGLAHLREAYGKFKSTEPLPKHVFFGNMTRSQHEMLQCRHFEGHLGFVKPSTV